MKIKTIKTTEQLNAFINAEFEKTDELPPVSQRGYVR